jgi:hypothetical protein
MLPMHICLGAMLMDEVSHSFLGLPINNWEDHYKVDIGPQKVISSIALDSLNLINDRI